MNETIVKESRNFPYKGTAVMLSKYGDVYEVINNSYHPNPGPKSEGYPEIDECINWLYEQGLAGPLKSDLEFWMNVIFSVQIIENDSIEDASDIIYLATYLTVEELSDSFVRRATEIINELMSDKGKVVEFAQYDYTDLSKVYEKVSDFINEKFLRVRVGGKLDSKGEDAIYFRISSHGFDWHRNITEFLWDTFGDIKSMPRRIWIGHDEETNPPETVIFDGSPESLFDDFDSKLFEDFRERTSEYRKTAAINEDRKSFYLNKEFAKYNRKTRITRLGCR